MFYTADTANRGTRVHVATALYDRGKLDVDKVPTDILGYVLAWARFLDENPVKIITIEERVWQPHFRYAGTLDRRIIYDGVPGVLDIKSGAVEAGHALQTAAYAHCPSEHGAAVRRYACYLKQDATYKLVEHRDLSDLTVFLSALTVTNYKQRTGVQTWS